MGCNNHVGLLQDHAGLLQDQVGLLEGQECNPKGLEGPQESETVPLQKADKRFLSRYELLLSEEEIQFCQRKWAAGGAVKHPVYQAWEALKQSSLTAEELQSRQEKLAKNKKQAILEKQEQEKRQDREVRQAMEEEAGTQVLIEHTPKNIQTVKRKIHARMPEGVDRFLPTSSSRMEILVERSAKQKQKKQKK